MCGVWTLSAEGGWCGPQRLYDGPCQRAARTDSSTRRLTRTLTASEAVPTPLAIPRCSGVRGASAVVMRGVVAGFVRSESVLKRLLAFASSSFLRFRSLSLFSFSSFIFLISYSDLATCRRKCASFAPFSFFHSPNRRPSCQRQRQRRCTASETNGPVGRSLTVAACNSKRSLAYRHYEGTWQHRYCAATAGCTRALHCTALHWLSSSRRGVRARAASRMRFRFWS